MNDNTPKAASSQAKTPREGAAHRTVSRVTSILELVSASEPSGMSLAALADSLQAPKSSAHGLVQGLLSVGYLVGTDGIYHLGPAPGALLRSAQPPLAERARHDMETLRDQIDETVVLSELVGDTFVYVGMIEAHQAIHYSTPLGKRHALVPMSAGRAFLAGMDDKSIDSYLRTHPDVDRNATMDDITEIRRTGTAINRELTVPGLSAVASTIGNERPARWALSVAGPTDRLSPRMDEIAAKVAITADRIALLL